METEIGLVLSNEHFADSGGVGGGGRTCMKKAKKSRKIVICVTSIHLINHTTS